MGKVKTFETTELLYTALGAMVSMAWVGDLKGFFGVLKVGDFSGLGFLIILGVFSVSYVNF